MSRSKMQSSNAQVKNSGNGSETMTKTVVNNTALVKPEIMSDRQILKRLNNNIKHSKVFQSVNFKSLP